MLERVSREEEVDPLRVTLPPLRVQNREIKVGGRGGRGGRYGGGNFGERAGAKERTVRKDQEMEARKRKEEVKR